jgi:integrase
VQYLKPDELKKLLEVAAKSKRDVAMIVLSYRHGLRAAELCGLLLSDVDEENNRLTVRAAKKRSKKGITYFETFQPKDPIAGSDLTVLHAWLKERAECRYALDSDALFLSAKGGALLPRAWGNRFRELAKEANLRSEIRHCHALRHTAAMASIAGGAQLHEVTKIMRHKSLASLTPYVEVSQDDADLAKAKAFAKWGGR